MPVTTRFMAGAIGALLAAGCEVPELPGDVPVFLNGDQVACGTCGGNARAADVDFHELDGNPVAMERVPNNEGLWIERFVHLGTGEDLGLEVEVDELIGISTTGILTRELLEGTELVLRRDGEPNKTYHLEIRKFQWTPFFVDSGEREVPSYEFWYYVVEGGGPHKDPVLLCENVDDGTGDVRGSAFFFKGDRYDVHTRAVQETGFKSPWFNIACHGTAISKLHRIRHTLAGSTAARMTGDKQRQAYFKMFTADYCGTDYQFTVNGHPLHYGDRQGFLHAEPGTTFEAVWNDRGALCLDTPRMYTFEEILVIEPDCRLPPPCTPDQVDQPFAYGYVQSRNPTRDVIERPDP
jgi:hypothetical protein